MTYTCEECNKTVEEDQTEIRHKDQWEHLFKVPKARYHTRMVTIGVGGGRIGCRSEMVVCGPLHEETREEADAAYYLSKLG